MDERSNMSRHAKRELIHALETGDIYRGPTTLDQHDWPVLPASVIRDLLRGVNASVRPDPRGLRLHHVYVAGRLDLDHLETNIALDLHECALPEGITARHSRLSGISVRKTKIEYSSATTSIIDLVDATVRFLDLTDTTLVNPKGPALLAERIHVAGSMLLNNGFTAQGFGTVGAVRLSGARITGRLDLGGARLSNDDGAAMVASVMHVDGSVFLDDGFTAAGKGKHGAVRLLGANIAGQLNMLRAELTNAAGPALYARSMTIEQDFLLDLVANHTSTPPDIDLTAATVRGRLKITATSLPTGNGQANSPGTWAVNGLTYRILEDVTAQQWLELLAHGTTSYTPQPYQQLATVARSEGHEDVARRALIAQHDDQLARSKTEAGLLTWWERCKKRILKYTVGYGYRPWWALLWLLGIVVIALVMYEGWNSTGSLALVNPETLERLGSCQRVDVWMLASEVLPLQQSDTQCSPVKGTEAFFLITTFLKLGAWATVTLFIAGFT